MARGRYFLVGLAFSACAGGCSGSDDSTAQTSPACTPLKSTDAPAFEGIYTLTRYTRNETACDAEGPSILETQSERLLYIGLTSFAGLSTLLLQSCTTADDCRTKYGEAQNGGFGSSSWILFQFSCSDAPGTAYTTMGWTGSWSDDGTCHEPAVSYDELTRDGPNLHLESRTSFGEAYPQDADGFCTTDLGYAAAKDEPCTQFEVLEATFVEPL